MFVRTPQSKISTRRYDDSDDKRDSSERRSRRHYTRSDSVTVDVPVPRPLPPEKDSATVTVSDVDLQTTFENLRSVIKSTDGDSLSKDTVVKMLESVYHWMVFDKDFQLTVPSVPGSHKTSKMWPHGSTIDTRKKGDANAHTSSPRFLRRVTEDEASAIASSVVSSEMDEEMSTFKKGSVIYGSMGGTMGESYTRPSMRSRDYPPVLPNTSHADSPRGGYGMQTGPYQPVAAVGSRLHQPRSAARYSMIAGPVHPPLAVPETPASDYVRPTENDARKKTRVGVAQRHMNMDEAGDNVVFVD